MFYRKGLSLKPFIKALSLFLFISTLAEASLNAGIRPIAVCQRPDIKEENAAHKAPLKKVTPNEHCWINLQQFLHRQETQALRIIDVRKPASQFRPIAESIRLTLNDLQVSQLMKHENIVLVGDGYDRAELDHACVALQAQGYGSVAILAGGAPVLDKNAVQNQGALSFSTVTAEQYQIGSRSINWKTVATGLTAEQAAILPQRPEVNLTLKEISTPAQQRAAAARIKKIAASVPLFAGMPEPTPLVIIAADAAAVRQAQTLLGGHLPENILWLKGGFNAYADYMQRQQTMANGKGRRLITPCG